MWCTRWTSRRPSARSGCARSWGSCSVVRRPIVQRYGGTVDKFTGDGIMAVFGAPIALEDHALRACRAALDIQKGCPSLEDEVEHRDHVALQLRIGLNSGEVITGEIGSGPMSYTAVGEQVGMAQRMEAVAPPGGVMVSDSTARLVDTRACSASRTRAHQGRSDSGSRAPAAGDGDRSANWPGWNRVSSGGSGRWARSTAFSSGRVNGNGSIVGLVGPPGIGKSRIVREIDLACNECGCRGVHDIL